MTATGWLDALPDLRPLDDPTRALLAREAVRVEFKPGTVLFRPGDVCANFLIVLAGSVRVHLLSELGREIVLYRVGAGSTCILTTSCLIGREDYSAEGMAENTVSAMALPKSAFEALIVASPVFREFVFHGFGTRLTDLMRLVGEVAFGRIDRRLAEALLHQAPEGGTVPLTHQVLATELGTAREVVSRQLKEFERHGLVGLGRGRLEVLDTTGLRDLAAAASG